MGLPNPIDPTQDLGLPFSNYAEVADPTTDLDATYYETLCISNAGMSLTAPRAWVVVSAAATAGYLVRDHSAMWGDTDAVKPTVTCTATGAFAITWAASYPDLNPTASRAVTGTVNMRTCTIQMHAAGLHYATAAANVITVHTTTIAGTASNIDFTAIGY